MNSIILQVYLKKVKQKWNPHPKLKLPKQCATSITNIKQTKHIEMRFFFIFLKNAFFLICGLKTKLAIRSLFTADYIYLHIDHDKVKIYYPKYSEPKNPADTTYPAIPPF